MSLTDLAATDRLREQAGWNQTNEDWERLLRWQPDGCFIAEAGDEVAASVTTTPLAGVESTAWLGMLLVDESRRRQGIARTLLSHAVGWLAQHGVATVALDATPLGKTLYDRAGFGDVYSLQRQHALVPDLHSPPSGDGLIQLQPDVVASVAELDAAAFFGLDRLFLLRDLCSAHPSGCWLKVDGSGAVEGYALSRPGVRAWYLGPLIARDEAVAETLLRALLAPLAAQPAMIDTLDANPRAGSLVARYGFEPVRPFIRMARGTPLPDSRTDWYFAMAGPEIG